MALSAPDVLHLPTFIRRFTVLINLSTLLVDLPFNLLDMAVNPGQAGGVFQIFGAHPVAFVFTK